MSISTIQKIACILLCLIGLTASISTSAADAPDRKKYEYSWLIFGDFDNNMTWDQYLTASRSVYNHYSSDLAANTTITLNARYLGIKKSTAAASSVMGNVVVQTKRTFVTQPSFFDKVKLTIFNQTDEKRHAPAKITVFSHGPNFDARREKEYAISRDKVFSKEVEIDNIKGRVLTIQIKNDGATQGFPYKIKAIGVEPAASPGSGQGILPNARRKGKAPAQGKATKPGKGTPPSKTKSKINVPKK